MSITTPQLVNHSEDLFIGGRWAAPIDGRLIDVLSPATEQPISRVALGGPRDIDAAVASARAAFDESPWSHLPVRTRANHLAALAEQITASSEHLATIITAEIGTPIGRPELRHLQAQVASGIIDGFVDLVDSYPWVVHRSSPTAEVEVRRAPVGVVGAIIPWNVPVNLALLKIVPALLAGCTVILKAPEEAPLSSVLLGELAVRAGLPEGVLSIVPADRPTSELLVRHPGVDKISFTGSSRAGKKVAALCGEQLKRVSLELGGKSAAIILPDADLDAVMPVLIPTTILNNGQICYNQTRVLAPREKYGEVVDALTAAYSTMQVGDPFDVDTDVGPLVSATQRDRVQEYLRIGEQEGARITTGGGRPPGLDRGYYVEPTVFDRVENGMRIAQEEIFGPVVAVIPYDGEEDAVRIANDSVYGLSGSVWTADEDHGRHIARRIRTGSVGINSAWPDSIGTYGGFKNSGIGRESGPEGLDAYTEVQTVQSLPRPDEQPSGGSAPASARPTNDAGAAGGAS